MKPKKIISLLSGLGEDITVRDATRVKLNNGSTRIDLTIRHKAKKRPCPRCDSSKSKKHGLKDAWAMHLPQGKREFCRILYKKQRFKCLSCGATFLEDVDWVYGNSRLSLSLYDAVSEDLSHFIPKKEIARMNGISAYYVDFVASSLTPPVPARLPEVICLDETHSGAEEESDSKTVWLRYITSFSDGETGELLDILPFRTIKKLTKYFKSHFSYDERCKVKYLCCDMAECYIGLVKKCFPNAVFP